MCLRCIWVTASTLRSTDNIKFKKLVKLWSVRYIRATWNYMDNWLKIKEALTLARGSPEGPPVPSGVSGGGGGSGATKLWCKDGWCGLCCGVGSDRTKWARSVGPATARHCEESPSYRRDCSTACNEINILITNK